MTKQSKTSRHGTSFTQTVTGSSSAGIVGTGRVCRGTASDAAERTDVPVADEDLVSWKVLLGPFGSYQEALAVASGIHEIHFGVVLVGYDKNGLGRKAVF